MRLITIPNMPDDFKLTFFGDRQEGNIAKAHDKMAECIDGILAEPNHYAVHMGDACDAFYTDDPRYDPLTITNPPLEQMEEERRQLLPLVHAGRLLVELEGNHERALNRKIGSFSERLCAGLREASGSLYPYFGTYTCKIEFQSTTYNTMFKVYLTHGRRSITSVSPDPHRRRAYMQFRLKRLLENKAGDCICMVRGHSHIVLVTPPIPTLYLNSEQGRIQQHYTTAGHGGTSDYIPPEHRFYGCSGSFLKSQELNADTYSEVFEYDPLEIGYLTGIVTGGRFVDLREVKV